MVKIYLSTVINAPIKSVWSLIRDFNGHSEWHPAVTESKIEGNGPADAVGAVRVFMMSSGERMSERLLSLSDLEHKFSYELVASELPIMDYIAHVALKRITDKDQTFWEWQSRFRTTAGKEVEMSRVVREDVYKAGFEAIRARVERRPRSTHDR